MGCDWRQGSLFSRKDAQSLGLCPEDGQRVVVISHDCDLDRSEEFSEKFEVMIARDLEQEYDRQYLRGRHVRTLHLHYEAQATTSSPFYLELTQTERQWLDGAILQNHQPDATSCLSPEEKRHFKHWLAAYYGRSAFPNAFEERMRRQKLHEKIQKILDRSKDSILAVFFDLNGDEDRELPPETPYSLSIYIIFIDQANPSVGDEVEQLFETVYPNEEADKIIWLDQCVALHQKDFSFANSYTMNQWRVEQISLRQDPSGPYVPQGA